MNKGSLTFPADPLAAMRELSDLDAPSASPLPPSSVSTEIRKPVSTDARADAITEVNPPVRKSARAEVSKPARQNVHQEAKPEASTEMGFLDVVDAALASREPLTGGVKATVDMSFDLSTRAKRYLADHRGQNTRQVLIALLDAFLKAKGY